MDRKPGFYWVRAGNRWTVLEWANSMVGPGWVADGLVQPTSEDDDPDARWIEPPAA